MAIQATRENIEKLPKTDLHRHLIGCIRARTAGDLAQRHGVSFPAPVEEVYARINSSPTPEEQERGPWYPLLTIYRDLCRCLVTAEDFERVAYESLEDGLNYANVLYQELSFSPSVHLSYGVSYATMIEGLAAGLKSARADLGVDARLICAIDRERDSHTAVEMVDEVAQHPCDDVVGVGLDFHEAKGAPEVFTEAFAQAKAAGLSATAHSCEHVDKPQNAIICVDQLGCSRLDHGYYVLGDESSVSFCRDRNIPFNVAFTTSRHSALGWRRDCIKEMYSRGLNVTINSDDPRLFGIDLNHEYEVAADVLDADLSQLAELALNGVDATFLDESDKAALRGRFTAQLKTIQASD